ncbi:MAG: helix-turn-helix transcriptional regulator [Pseudomonadota bacterium]
MSLGKAGKSTISRDVFIDPVAFGGDARNLMFGSLPKVTPDDEDMIVPLILSAVRRPLRRRLPRPPRPSFPAEILDAVREGREAVRDIARSTRLSREGFIRKFDREMGMTPHAYRLAERVSLARALLRSGQTPVFAAHEAGFADQSHLGRVFRRAFGTTPARFRQAWRV